MFSDTNTIHFDVVNVSLVSVHHLLLLAPLFVGPPGDGAYDRCCSPYTARGTGRQVLPTFGHVTGCTETDDRGSLPLQRR